MECRNWTETRGNKTQAQLLSEDVSHVIYGYLLPSVCAFGIVGNLLNLTILTRRKLQKSFRTLEQAANLCLISLAVSDLMFCVFAFPSVFLPIHDIYFSKGVLLIYRQYSAAVINVFIMISTWLTVAMSLERYLAICHPLRQDLYLTTRRIKIVIVLTYLLSFAFNVPVLWRYEIHNVCPQSLPQDIAGDQVLTNGKQLHVDASRRGSTLAAFLSSTTPFPSTSFPHRRVGDSSTFSGFPHKSRYHRVHRYNASAVAAYSSLNTKAIMSGLLTSELALPDAETWTGKGPGKTFPSTPAALVTAESLFPETGNDSELVVFRADLVKLMGSDQLDTAYRILWAVINNIIPLVLLVYFNVCLCRKIFRSYKMRQKFKQEHHSGHHDNSSHVLTITLVVIVVMFCALVAPSEIVIHAATFTNNNENHSYRTVEAFMNFMQCLNFSVNFILYCIISPYFRKTLKYIFCCGCYNIYQVSKQWRKEFETSLM